MREFKSVSPSQINAYNDCPRLWWYQSVLGLPTPQRPSAALGTAVHEQLESYMDSGKLPDDSVAGKIAKPGLSLLPEPGTGWTEVKMHDEDTQDKWPKLFLSGLPVNGYIDLLNMTGERPLVLDHKTTSDLKYAKTAEELRSDPQMVIYGSFALSACASQGVSADAVDTGHVVYLTKGAPFAKKTTVTLDRKHLDAERAKLEVTVEQMKTHASARSPDAVPGEPTSCSKYGGCFFQDRCRASGLIHSPTTFAEVFRKAASTPDNNTTESLMSPVDPFAALKAIQARKAAAAASSEPTVVTTVAPVAPVAPEVAPEVATDARAALLAKYGINKGVTPPPALVVVAGPASEAPAEDAKTVRKPKGYAEKLAALNWTEAQIARMNAEAMRAVLDGSIDGTRCSVLPSGHVKVVLREAEPENNVPHILSLDAEEVSEAVAPVAVASAPTLTLYIDCFPDKGRDRNYLTLEDVIVPLCAEAVALHNRGAKDAERVDFYGLIPYNRGPTYIAAMLLKAPPVGVIVCSTRYPATNACLEVLVPLADVVIRGR